MFNWTYTNMIFAEKKIIVRKKHLLTWEWIYLEYLLLLITKMNKMLANSIPNVSVKTTKDCTISPTDKKYQIVTFWYLGWLQLLLENDGGTKTIGLVTIFHPPYGVMLDCINFWNWKKKIDCQYKIIELTY